MTTVEEIGQSGAQVTSIFNVSEEAKIEAEIKRLEQLQRENIKIGFLGSIENNEIAKRIKELKLALKKQKGKIDIFGLNDPYGNKCPGVEKKPINVDTEEIKKMPPGIKEIIENVIKPMNEHKLQQDV